MTGRRRANSLGPMKHDAAYGVRVAAGVLAALLLAACYRQVIETIDVKVPQMRTDAAADLIRGVLGAFDTNVVQKVETDVSNRVVRVRYNSERGARRNIEVAIADAGFDANDLPGDAERRKALPPECQ